MAISNAPWHENYYCIVWFRTEEFSSGVGESVDRVHTELMVTYELMSCGHAFLLEMGDLKVQVAL